MAPERPLTRIELPQSNRQISYDETADLSIVTSGGAHHRKQGEWPLSACVVRQIQRQVARAGRSLKRLEVQGTIIDNFESLGPLSPPSPSHRSHISIKRESDLFEEEGAQSLPRSVIKREDDYYEEESVDADEPDTVSVNSQIYVPVIKREGRSIENVMNSTSSHSRSNHHTPLKRELEYDDESIGADGVNTSEENLNEDNDLTNLTWLQDRNLLRSINLAKGENDELRPMSVQISPRTVMSGASPTSDYLEDSFASEPADSNSSDQPAPSPCPSPAHTPLKNMIPNGFVTSTKSGSASKGKHPYDVPYNPLVHTQNKPPYSFSCLIFMAIEDSPKKALPVKDIYSWILEHFPYFRNAPTGWKNSVRHNLSLNKCFLKVEKLQSLGKGSLWMVDDLYRNNLLQAFSRSPFHPCCPSTVRSPSPMSPIPDTSDSIPELRLPVAKETNLIKGAPNPELFPFLSRRLAATTTKSSVETLKESLSDHDSCDSLDEVVAATMVLALKHGPGVLPPPLISSCPTQDHTYSAATGSPETGYGSDEEQRRTAEALLHLAGLPMAPETTSQLPFKPRLLRRAPKRPAQSASFETPNCHTINNNCGSQADRNLVRVKRSRQQL